MAIMSEENPDVARFQRLLRRGGGHVHMVGVCGIGMAGIASLLANRGLLTTGCDMQRNRLAPWLKAQGVYPRFHHSSGHMDMIPAPDAVVYSPAVDPNLPELFLAQYRGVPLCRRGEVLPLLLEGVRSVAVGGTHGKTTTSSLIAQLLLGLGQQPGWCIGGENRSLPGVSDPGDGTQLVVEADESDGTLALYHADVAVITNIEFDHMEHFESVETFEACFRTFAAQARQRVIYCADDARAAEICADLPASLSYGFSATAALRGEDLQQQANGQRFRATLRGGASAEICLPFAGVHNALNTLAAVAVGIEYGFGLDEIARALNDVTLPRRRFDVLLETDDLMVVSDYAHHPSEIAALVQMAQTAGRSRVRAIFQPHRYTRTHALLSDFPHAFEGIDELILTPVYAAWESPMPGGTVWDLYRTVRERSVSCSPRVATSLAQGWLYLRRTMRPGDLLLVIGAGDIENVARWASGAEPEGTESLAAEDLAAQLARVVPPSAIRPHEPIARHTTLRVGGTAEAWVDVESLSALQALYAHCRERDVSLQIVGGGSNILCGDLDVSGVVARLTGGEFCAIRHDGNVVAVGAGVPLPALLESGWRAGLGGAEFLEGVPGSVGGALRMNAGAFGQELGNRVEWIQTLGPDGLRIRQRGELAFSYRASALPAAEIIIEAGIALDPMDKDEIAARRADYGAKRRWMNGLHTAGSIFKNPEGCAAGRLLDEAGLKGKRVGGAQISDQHANVIVSNEGATASDVISLMVLAEAMVEQKHGIRLEREVVELA